MTRENTHSTQLDFRRLPLTRIRWRLMTVLLLVAVCAGCSGGKSQDSADPAPQSVSQVEETWDVIHIANKKVGHAHTVVSKVDGGRQQLLKYVQQVEMAIERFGQATTMQMTLESLEKENGQIVRLRCDQVGGTEPIVTTGQESMGRLLLETKSLGKTEPTELELPESSWGGFFAIEQSLENKPMKPGEKRTLRTLMPVFNEFFEARLEAVAYEETAMLSGTRELLKIKCVLRGGATKFDQTIWTDRNGETIKTLMPGIDQTTYRTTKEIAQGKSEVFDLGKMSVVRVKRRLEDPHATRRIVYKAHVPEGDLSDAFETGATQTVKTIDKETVIVEVRAMRPNDSESLEEADNPPTPDDSAPNHLVQSDDRLIKEMAAEVAPQETDHWKLAIALEKYVHEKIEEKNFSQALATAAEVARTLEGDCTEHAMLLVAVCRARQIPARAAIGLVHFRDGQGDGFAYHMWTEAWIVDRWVPLDATLGRGGIGAAHLKLASSSLDGSSAYNAFAPVIQVIGRLQLELLEVE